MNFHKNILQIDVVNVSIMLNLDTKSANWDETEDMLTFDKSNILWGELGALTSVGHYLDPNTNINTGFKQRI